MTGTAGAPSGPGDPDADLNREIDRVADRLRVLGPRWSARPAAGAALDGVLGPLEQVREVLQLLADLAADAEGRPHRLVPRLAPHALADQVLVLGHDLDATADAAARAAGTTALAGLRRAL